MTAANDLARGAMARAILSIALPSMLTNLATALFGLGLIDAIPDAAILANERNQRLKLGLSVVNGEQVPAGRAAKGVAGVNGGCAVAGSPRL